MKQFCSFLLRKKISADQFSILVSINEDTCYTKNIISFDQYADDLITKGYLSFSKNKYYLTLAGDLLLKEAEVYFKKSPSRSNPLVSFEEWKPYIEAYREMFPKNQRNNTKILFERFKWFIHEFDFDWSVILAATKAYIDYESKNNGGMYIKKSMYFIKKEERSMGKTTVQSVLADWCDRQERGEIDESNERYFGDNIV